MHAAIICDSDVFAGTERHMVELAQAMRGLGHPVAVVCPTDSPVAEQSKAAGIDVIPLKMVGAVDPNAVASLARILRERVDLLHVHNGRTMLHGALAKSFAGRGRVVATQHFMRPSRVGRRGVRAWASRAAHRWVSARVDQHIAISEAVRAEMLRRGDADAAAVRVVHNGIEAPPVGTPPARRELPGVGDVTSKIVFCASRLEREKDVGTLLSAMARVIRSVPDATCLIAGDGAMRAELEHAIHSLGLSGAVHLPGFRTDVPALMAAADVFVLPSAEEPFGLVLLEAMAAGKAVIATRAGGPVEIVIDGETGLLVPPRDADAMGQAITELLQDDDKRTAMGRAGRRRVEEHFSAERMAEETLEVYRRALALPGGRDQAAIAAPDVPRAAEEIAR